MLCMFARLVTWACLGSDRSGPAGSGDKRPCIMQNNTIFFDKQIVLRKPSTANSLTDCCTQCSSIYAPDASPSEKLFNKSCNLWTW